MRRRTSMFTCLLASATLLAGAGCTNSAPFGFLNDNDNGAETGNTNDDGGTTVNDNGGDSSIDDNTDNDTNTNDNTSTALDSDGDGFSDEQEQTGIPGSDPLNPNDTPENPIDSDGDGCSDFDETHFVGFCDANPNTDGGSSDTDPIIVEDPDTAFTFSLTVARHADVSFSDSQIDAQFADAGAILQSAETQCADVATDTTFARDGNTALFTAGGASLTAESQLDAVFAELQDVKIVDMMVGVCGVPADGDFSIVLGCATSGGSLVITTIAAADVWAHEWGHVQGLAHRDGCPRNVMHSFEVDTNAVNAAERAAFLSDTPSGFAKVAMLSTPSARIDQLAKTAAESLPQWLHRLAGKQYIAGVPTAVIDHMHDDATDHLLAMLDGPAAEGYHQNVVRMLGFTGDARSCGPLMDLIDSAAGELSFGGFAALTESFLALGRLASHETDGAALAFLIAGTDPATWTTRGANWTYRSHRDQTARVFMTRLSVLALGLTHHPAALDHLHALRSLTADDPENGVVFADQIDEAIGRLDGSALNARRAGAPARQP